LYAVRYQSRWVLTGALQRHTRGWHTRRVGAIVYHHPSAHNFDQLRAARADAFVDSTARNLGVTPPATIDYYLAQSADQMAAHLGFDWLLLPSGPGTGYGGWGSGAVYSGDPRRGEDYLHELAHVVVAPLREGGTRHGMLGEGFATWVGGSQGLNFAQLLDRLIELQGRTTSFSWSQIEESVDAQSQYIVYATGALVVDAVFRRRGWDGVRQLLLVERGDEAFFTALAGLLGISRDGFERWWREETLEARRLRG
jgi:hypothetical protein